MRVLSEPLHQSEAANRAELAAREEQASAKMESEGSAEGNRHQRRLAAKRARRSLARAAM